MRAGEQLGGPSATAGRETVLENDEVVFVVERRRTNPGRPAGAATCRRGRRPRAAGRARALATYFGDIRASTTRVDYERDDDGDGADGERRMDRRHAARRLRRRATRSQRARPRAPRRDDAGEYGRPCRMTADALGDAIRWGAAERSPAGKARGFSGARAARTSAVSGASRATPMTSTEGTIDAVSASSWTDDGAADQRAARAARQGDIRARLRRRRRARTLQPRRRARDGGRAAGGRGEDRRSRRLSGGQSSLRSCRSPRPRPSRWPRPSRACFRSAAISVLGRARRPRSRAARSQARYGEGARDPRGPVRKRGCVSDRLRWGATRLRCALTFGA